MPTDPASAAKNASSATGPVATRTSPALWRFAPFILLLLLALPDLLSPPISPTILRQTQTFAQTINFVAAGFSPQGLTIDIEGSTPFRVVYEFPLYQALCGTFFLAFSPAVFWGKLISLLAGILGLYVFYRLVREHYGEAMARRASLLFTACPITLLLTTAFQPDAFALTLTLWSLWLLLRWRAAPSIRRWLAFVVVLLLAGLAKFTLLVPWMPLMLAAALHNESGWRWPRLVEITLFIAIFLVPFVSWYWYRQQLMDPRYLTSDTRDFFLGDLRRFLRPGFYVKPAFILSAMVCCGAGTILVAAGLRRLRRIEALLLAGIALYFIIIPTAADQTYYAYGLVPALAVLMAQGLLSLEERVSVTRRQRLRWGFVAVWSAGFAIAAPYTLRQDWVSLTAAEAAKTATAPQDLLFVINMHDRGVGIGGFNPTIVTLAGRRGWNVDFSSANFANVRTQIAQRRAEGARWIVATWFTSELDPWFIRFVPGVFSRQPRVDERPVDGAALVAELAGDFPVVARGSNHAVLRIP